MSDLNFAAFGLFARLMPFGLCVVCGDEVRHAYPWKTERGYIHEECIGRYIDAPAPTCEYDPYRFCPA